MTKTEYYGNQLMGGSGDYYRVSELPGCPLVATDQLKRLHELAQNSDNFADFTAKLGSALEDAEAREGGKSSDQTRVL